ncbi:MAG: Gfo/Idh/MocA family protein [Rubripirellula sp.]
MKLRIGLIGLGDGWQTRHRPALRMLHDRFDVRAVYSPVAKLAENSAAEFQADAVDGYRALVSRCDIDAVMVLKRTWLGWLPMLAAAEAGKAIYWAGDFDIDPVADASVREAIEKSGVTLMVEFPRRFAPATLRLKELIATRLGPPQLVFCHRRIQADSQQQKLGCDGSSTRRRDLVELIDWCRYVVNREPDQVVSTGSDSTEATGYQCLSLQFPATKKAPAVTAQISCGNYIRPTWHEAASFRPPSAMQIVCERGVAFIDLPSSLVWFDDAGRHLESLETELPVGEQLLTQFHRSVTSLLRNISELDDAYRAAQILAAARTSERDGCRVSVELRRKSWIE